MRTVEQLLLAVPMKTGLRCIATLHVVDEDSRPNLGVLRRGCAGMHVVWCCRSLGLWTVSTPALQVSAIHTSQRSSASYMCRNLEAYVFEKRRTLSQTAVGIAPNWLSLERVRKDPTYDLTCKERYGKTSRPATTSRPLETGAECHVATSSSSNSISHRKTPVTKSQSRCSDVVSHLSRLR